MGFNTTLLCGPDLDTHPQLLFAKEKKSFLCDQWKCLFFGKLQQAGWGLSRVVFEIWTIIKEEEAQGMEALCLQIPDLQRDASQRK